MLDIRRENFGKIIKQQRLSMSLTLHDLSTKSGVSPSHLGRIEKGERYPSATVLRRIARPLGFNESELFTLAGYLSSNFTAGSEKEVNYPGNGLDPYVARVLSQESLEVQRAVIGILTILKSIAASTVVPGIEFNRMQKPEQVPKS